MHVSQLKLRSEKFDYDDDDDDDDDNNNNNNNKELQENSYIGHFKHTSESASVKVQNIFHGRRNITCTINCNYRTAATLRAQETWLFFSGT